jgi:AcrR family transcriptional regulator
MTTEEMAKLPPGKHGLPKEFVRANQRTRLLESAAASIAAKGAFATTIADITDGASVSRRTFYEQFGDKEQLIAQLIDTLVAEIWQGIRAVTSTEDLAERLLAYSRQRPEQAHVIAAEAQAVAFEAYAGLVGLCAEATGTREAAVAGIFWGWRRHIAGAFTTEELLATAAIVK